MMSDLKANWVDTDNFLATDQNDVSTRVNEHDASIKLKYAKPETGIPEVDLVSAVRQALQLARSAIQPGGPIGGGAPQWDTIDGRPNLFPPIAHTHTKAEVGLDKVDNVADADKPFSAAQIQQIGDYIGQVAVPSALGIAKGDLIVATGVAGQFQRLPRPENGYMYVADSSYPLGYKQVLPSAGGGGGGPSNDSRIVAATTKLGDGRAAGTSYVYTHNLGTKSLWPVITRIDTGEIISAKCIPNTTNTMIITPDVVWDNSSRRVRLFGFLGLIDEVAPSTPPTLTYVSTVGNKIKVNVSGGTDNVGVLGYNMFYDTGGAKTYVGSTGVGDYEYTLPSSGTSYNLTATAYDAEGLESAYSTALVRSTAAAPEVQWVASSTGTKRYIPASGANTVVMTNKITPVAGESLVAHGHISHNAWVANADYDVVSVTDDKGGTWVRVPGLNLANVDSGGSQPSGSVMSFYCLNPEVGVEHTVTMTITDASFGGNIAQSNLTVERYANVAAVSSPILARSVSGAVVNLVMPSKAKGMNVWAISCEGNAGNMTGLNKTVRYGPIGANLAGYADYFASGDAVGLTGNNTLTSTSNRLYAAIGFLLEGV